MATLSVSAYQSDLEQYSRNSAESENRALREARRQDVRDFLNALLSNGVDGRSVARKLSALQALLQVFAAGSYITADPTLNIDTPRQWKVLPKSLAADEVESVLQGPPRAKDDRMSQALALRIVPCWKFSTLAQLRVSEVINLKLEDLKLELGLCAGARQGRQGAHCATGWRRAGDCADSTRGGASGAGGGEVVAHFVRCAGGTSRLPASGCGRW